MRIRLKTKKIFANLILSSTIALSAFAETPCESTVLTHAITKLMDADNCQEQACHVLGGKVVKVGDNAYHAVVEYNSSGNIQKERYEESSTIEVKRTAQGCTI